MAALLDRLKARIEPAVASDAQLEEMISSAIAIFVKLKYPYGNYPQDNEGKPALDFIAEDWVLRAAIELFNKQGAEGQTSHNENGISRSYESGTISSTLKLEIIPTCGVAKGQ